ncbi:Integrin-linked protein kinase 1 [Cocos nucifera]|uniref:Integrin-linked protein kinase 1 n=1 Tax=Cocos nucifera TaxID=13894 RepID=A0A8K0MW30_COCNU|nr:Integrin-linked protein kinase 1 [Cocos nucifera]
MEKAVQLKRGILRQFSTGSLRKSGRLSFRRNLSFDPRLSNVIRFTFGRQSSLDPNCRSRSQVREELTVPENLDSTMQLLFMASQGDVKGVDELLKDGVDVNSIDLDGRTALHIAACEGHVDVVKLLLSWRANIDARDRWGSTKTRRTPMTVSNPREVPEYELNPGELQFRRGEEVLKGTYQVAKWNGTKVSVKILDRESYADPDCVNAFKDELTLLEKVRHPNVVQFVGAVTQNIPMMIVSEGMNYLHQCKPDPIIHCDLKPKNILLDGGGQLKVAGFGLIKLSKICPDKAKLAHPTESDISNLYIAPEVYKDEIFDRSVDVYSFGLIVYEMIEGAPAFHPKAPEEVAKILCLEGKRPSLKNKAKSYPSDFKDLFYLTISYPGSLDIMHAMDAARQFVLLCTIWKLSSSGTYVGSGLGQL